jgi:AhpD family alkylhydroperoxidase
MSARADRRLGGVDHLALLDERVAALAAAEFITRHRCPFRWPAQNRRLLAMSASPRLPLRRLSVEIYDAMVAFETAIRGSGLEPRLLELVKIRASQLNRCAYCIDMHTQDARAAGETEQRLFALPAWQETPFFTARERAALALTEAETLIAGGISDELHDETAAHFTDQERVALIWAIAAINTWNRVSIATGSVPGTYHRAP